MTRKYRNSFISCSLACTRTREVAGRGELVQTWQASQGARFQDSGSGPERCTNGHRFWRVGSGSQSRRLRAKARADCSTAAQKIIQTLALVPRGSRSRQAVVSGAGGRRWAHCRSLDRSRSPCAPSDLSRAPALWPSHLKPHPAVQLRAR